MTRYHLESRTVDAGQVKITRQTLGETTDTVGIHKIGSSVIEILEVLGETMAHRLRIDAKIQTGDTKIPVSGRIVDLSDRAVLTDIAPKHTLVVDRDHNLFYPEVITTEQKPGLGEKINHDQARIVATGALRHVNRVKGRRALKERRNREALILGNLKLRRGWV